MSTKLIYNGCRSRIASSIVRGGRGRRNRAHLIRFVTISLLLAWDAFCKSFVYWLYALDSFFCFCCMCYCFFIPYILVCKLWVLCNIVNCKFTVLRRYTVNLRTLAITYHNTTVLAFFRFIRLPLKQVPE